MRAGAVVCLVALGACKLSASFDDGRFRCSETSPCPPGRTCQDGYCELPVDTRDAAVADPAVLGDVLMFTFDDVGLPSARDRSGHRFDCSGGGVQFAEGVYGGGAHMMPNNFLVVPDQPELFLGNQLTIEAWIFRDMPGELDPIFGDRTVDPMVAAEYALEVTTEDRLQFVTNDSCIAGPGEIATSDPEMPIPAGEWVHVAAAWDGAEVRFYIGGEPAGVEPLAADPCELDRSPRIGRLQGNAGQLTVTGRIDELKLSSTAKSEADIRASMAFDSTELVGRCGDLVIENEGCDGESPCCDSASCQLTDADTACGQCELGVCQIGGDRVTDALVALYEFEEGGGTVVTDTSGLEPAVDLTISDAGDVTWGEGSLTIDRATAIASTGSTSKITLPCEQRGEMTIEAWIQPAELDQSGQIVAMGDGNESNASLGQFSDSYNGRARSVGTSSRGTPQVSSAIGDVTIELTHVVVRRQADGTRTLFVDGRERGINRAPGSMSSWSALPLALGDEAGTDHWLGRFDLVAIYCRALTDLEVAQNYNAGPTRTD